MRRRCGSDSERPVSPGNSQRRYSSRDALLHWDKKLVVVDCFDGTAAGDAEAAEKKWRLQEEIAGKTK